MGRILVVCPQRGFLELIQAVLKDAHTVEAFERYEPAINRLSADEIFDAVLCAPAELLRTVELFEQAAEHSADTRLLLIAKDAPQAAAFWERWNSDAKHKKRNGQFGQAWLPERCTAGEILALLQAPMENAAEEIELVTAQKPIAAPSLASESIIDGYRLMGVIGKGGFGTTWLAVNETSGKRVALKIVEGEEQTRQELAALRKYVHVADRSEHLLQIEHINRDALRLWIVTPLADSLTGGDTLAAYKPLSLANRLQAVGHLPEIDAARIAVGLVRALLTLHQGGLLHGDVSPSNILSRHGRWVLADPGLVRFQGEHGICRNKAYYPQPEVTRPCDDLCAVGVILWEMVSGIAEMVSGKERLRLDGQMLTFLSRKELPLAAFLGRAVAEKPEQRFMNAGDMLQDLELLVAALGRKPAAQNPLYHLLRPLRTS